ncbi:LuxR C-terminal-related transcriptional regulator [Hyphomicrobium sp.]|uniref:response regulator transcription factor n=1 Tax=Hyphomicrobium sp. TaxID=82 RepID=UPI0025C1AB3E|nr:LuxR C-terminal-related transcriptional regulator [Hyphomicrobium sp.]MCC7252393.1 response regulator transcription factor [Hyphomicrobium sp.]
MKHLEQNETVLECARNLTAHQKRILFLLSLGYQNKVIGAALGVTENTVKAHMTRILDALSCSNRTQAALVALCLRNEISIDEIVGRRRELSARHIPTDQQLDMHFFGKASVPVEQRHRFSRDASTSC